MKCTRCGEASPAEIHTCTPLAQRLADRLENAHSVRDSDEAAAELRRLYTLNAELVEALELIAGFTRSQFADSTDMAIECVVTACKALAKAKEQT